MRINPYFLGTVKGFLTGNLGEAFRYWVYAALYGDGDSYTEPFTIYAIGAIWFLWATFWGSIFVRISLNFTEHARIIFFFLLFLLGYYTRVYLWWFPLSIQAGTCAALFMYVGMLLRQMKDHLSGMPSEVKVTGCVLAFITWLCFIRDFQSFWFVHCDFGRGIVHIIGSGCGCIIVMMISRMIDLRMKRLSCFLGYFGKYSLLVLCVHIIELDLFPWGVLSRKLVQLGMPETCQFCFILITKLVTVLTCAYVLSEISFVKRLFGIRD